MTDGDGQKNPGGQTNQSRQANGTGIDSAHRRRRRTPVLAGIAVVVVLAVGAAVAVAVLHTDGKAAAPARHVASCLTAPVPASSTPGSSLPLQVSPGPGALPMGGTLAPASAAPDGGGIRVAEIGHSPLPAEQPEHFRTSIGAVLTNTSRHVAYGVTVTFSAVDTQGHDALFPGLDGVQEIPVILPGQQVGIGLDTGIASERRVTTAAKVTYRPVTLAKVTLRIADVRWYPSDGHWSPVTAGIETQSVDANGDLTLAYRSTSRYCRALTPRGTGVVYRDAGGHVIGGELQPTGTHACAPGTATVTVPVLSPAPALPKGVDLGRSEVYPYCDPAGITGSLAAGPGVPGNYLS